jgi:hypothetical protein
MASIKKTAGAAIRYTSIGAQLAVCIVGAYPILVAKGAQIVAGVVADGCASGIGLVCKPLVAAEKYGKSLQNA